MFFGPAQGFSHYSSLPRRTTGSAFQRNAPIRRSTGIPEHHLEYFVPRSVSEFNLSGVGDLAMPPTRRCSPTVQSSGLGLPHGLQLGPTQMLLCTPPPPPPPQMQMVMKPREKMVTFEDESKGLTHVTAAGLGNGAATHCPHGVPTTPRKTAGVLGSASAAGDIFI